MSLLTTMEICKYFYINLFKSPHLTAFFGTPKIPARLSLGVLLILLQRMKGKSYWNLESNTLEIYLSVLWNRRMLSQTICMYIYNCIQNIKDLFRISFAYSVNVSVFNELKDGLKSGNSSDCSDKITCERYMSNCLKTTTFYSAGWVLRKNSEFLYFFMPGSKLFNTFYTYILKFSWVYNILLHCETECIPIQAYD